MKLGDFFLIKFVRRNNTNVITVFHKKTNPCALKVGTPATNKALNLIR